MEANLTEANVTNGTNSTQPKKGSALLHRTEIVLLVFVLVGCFCTIRFAAHFIPLHFSVNFEEGNILNAALRITSGETPYPPVGGLPYVVNPYGPVLYYALAPLVKWLGLSFYWPRLLVLLSALVAALFLVLLLRRSTTSWIVSLGFGLSYLAVPLVRNWIYVLRVDLFAVALVLAGLYLYSTRRRPLWPALLFLAALFAKPTMLAAPLACWWFSMAAGDRRRAWSLIGWMTGLGLAALGIFSYATHGWGLFHLFLTHPDPYRLGHYFSSIAPVAILDLPLLFGVAALAVHDRRRRAISLPLAYFLLATVMTLTIGKLGSDANHLLEWQAALCLAAGCGYYAMRSLPKPESALALIPAGLVLLVFFTALHSPRLDPNLAGCPAAYRLAAQQPGELLSQNPGAAVLSGKKVWLSNPFEYEFLGNAGRLNQQPLIRLVQKRFFGLILLGGEVSNLQEEPDNLESPMAIWPPRFVSAVKQNYRPVARFSCIYASVAYEPVARPEAATPLTR